MRAVVFDIGHVPIRWDPRLVYCDALESDAEIDFKAWKLKPDPAICTLLLARTGLTPEGCIVIDDGPETTAGATKVGMDAIRFVGSESPGAALRERGLPA